MPELILLPALCTIDRKVTSCNVQLMQFREFELINFKHHLVFSKSEHKFVKDFIQIFPDSGMV